MTKRELQRYRDLVKECEELEEKIFRLESEISSAKIQVITGMPRGGNNENDKIGAAIAKIETWTNLYWEKVSMMGDEAIKIEKSIETLEPKERRLIRMRYIDGLSWEDICIRLNLKWRRVHEIHSSILKKLCS